MNKFQIVQIILEIKAVMEELHNNHFFTSKKMESVNFKIINLHQILMVVKMYYILNYH